MKEGLSPKARRYISKYSVLYETAAEGGYVAFVPALPGCRSQGETIAEAAKNIGEGAELYIESLIAHGESIPRERRSFHGIMTVHVLLRKEGKRYVRDVTR